MSVAVAFVKEYTEGKVLHAIGTITPSGNYASPETVDLRTFSAGVAPFRVIVNAPYPFRGSLTIGTGVDNGTIKFYTDGGAAVAVGVLTSDATNVADADTVTIGTTVYRFKTTIAQAFDVLRDASTAAASLQNLVKAINGTGTSGTTYFAGTTPHPNVSATASTATTISLEAKVPGIAGNAIATTETSAHLSFGAATLTGGVGVTGGELTPSAYPAGLTGVAIQFQADFDQLL